MNIIMLKCSNEHNYAGKQCRIWGEHRGGSRIFLRRGAPLRNGITDW